MLKVLVVVPTADVSFVEFEQVRHYLERRGFAVEVAAPQRGTVHTEEGIELLAHRAVADVREGEYEAIILLDGHGARQFLADEAVKHLVRNALALGLVVAANGEAVGALAEAGVLHERTVSAPTTMVERIEAAGARWSESPATAEGRVVTGRGEGAVAAFVKAVLREIQQVIRTAEGGGGV
ncbi:MAG TPA: DJ-1/PfpI family protein [Chloroflexota bacterium]